MVVRRRVLVSGRVQGVFFRVRTAERARADGLHGWVRNRPDGRVEAVLEGEEGAIERVVEWCRHGPERADVRDVEVSDEPPEGLRGFEIRG